MATKLSQSLDEILAEKKQLRQTGGGDRRRREYARQDTHPRDGVKKNQSHREHRNIDSEWVHDKYDGKDYRRDRDRRQRRDSDDGAEPKSAELRVDNIHYELMEEDLQELFRRIGPLKKLTLESNKRSGRSEGVAHVVYQSRDDALEAIRQFDGANAKGQPIRLRLAQHRNPFDTAYMPGRSLAERISVPDSRSRSRSCSPHTKRPNFSEEDAARKGIDRYIPGPSSRSRSPMPHRRPVGRGRRPGARRESAARDSGSRRQAGRDGKPRKTQEELDAEMADYFTRDEDSATLSMAAPPGSNGIGAADVDDVDMIL